MYLLLGFMQCQREDNRGDPAGYIGKYEWPWGGMDTAAQ